MRCGMHMQDLTKVQESGLNLGIQVCHWKDEIKLLENDIKNAEIGVTVWKWQAIQI